MFKNLIKTAAPKWTKMIADDLLSSEAVSKIVSKNTKTRDIKPLGVGGSQVVDLVAHPEYGLAVRKLPITNTKENIIYSLLNSSAMQMDWKKVDKLNHPNIARMLGDDGPVTYFEYVKPLKRDPSTRLGNLLTEVTANPNRYAVTRRNQVHNLDFKDFSDANIKHDPNLNNAVDQILTKFPHAGDFRVRNIVGNKIVDFETGTRAGDFKPRRYDDSYNSTKKIILGRK